MLDTPTLNRNGSSNGRSGSGNRTSEKTHPQVLSHIFTDHELPKPYTTLTYKKIRSMRKDPTIALARWLVVAPILESEWSTEEKDDAPKGAADMVREQILPLRNHLVKTGMYGCIDFGWQPYEKVWRNGEGDEPQWVIDKIKPLLQDFTTILVNKDTGAYAGLLQDSQYHAEVELKPHETLLYNFDVEGTDWYGQSVMGNAEKPYDRWETVDCAANRYDKKVAGSHWVITYPIGESELNGTMVDNYEVAKSFLSTLEASGAIAVPRQIAEQVDAMNADEIAWKIELLSDTGNTTTNFIDRMKYLDALKVRAFGWPERAVLEGQFGTKAEAGEHADIAISNMEQRHQGLVTATNFYVVDHLLRLNFGEQYEGTVCLKAAPITDLAMGFLREIYKSLVASPDGWAEEMDAVDLNALRERVGIPAMPEEVLKKLEKQRQELVQPRQVPMNDEGEGGNDPPNTSPAKTPERAPEPPAN